MYRASFVAVLLAAASGLVHAQGAINDGNATFIRGESPWDSTPAADLTGVSQTPTNDHVYQTGWAFRVGDDTRETFLPKPDVQQYEGAVSEMQWNDVAGRGLFRAVETSTVIGGQNITGSPSGSVVMRLTVQNLSLSEPVTLDVFHVIDMDVGGSGVGDTAQLIASGDTPTMRFDDEFGDVGYYYAEDADRFAIRTIGPDDVFFALDDDSLDDFESSVPSGDSDYTSGVQWSNRVLGPGQSLSFSVRFSINRPALNPDLSISMESTPNPVTQGMPLDHTIVVSNQSALPAPGASIEFSPFAPGIDVVGTIGCVNDPLGYPECDLGDIEAGAMREVSLRVVPAAGSPPQVVASATVDSPDISDIAPGNNTATIATSVNLLLSDLQISKTNDTDNEAADIDGWNWIIELRNDPAATAPADFAPGDRILLDRLPDVDVAYGLPVLSLVAGGNSPEVSGTASCQIANFDLVCTATSALSFMPGASATVTLPVLPQSLGSYTNPREQGGCMIDPDNAVENESIESNNFCADSVLSVDFMLFSDSFED
ncbi:DUF11 domain-containing protein [Chiayiivirga flava]|uniref:DUF11 domain-containing protein n=1 Tax=Chiayiivirga flava TaxID=659595 RepID=A0A7W8D5H3_9GAMM|nr:DUF11 domain-containing protein [Chiayiivirga flava]MBB5208271.1 hypothetical protein [Chiayiivirga flava]